MKVDGPITEILARKVHNEHDYYHQVVYPLLDELGFPEAYEDDLARWPQFPIKNPFGDGWLKLDYLSTIGSLPMLIIEGKERTDPTLEGAYREVPANTYGELERLVDLYQDTEGSNVACPNGPGLAAFPAIMAALQEPAAAHPDEDSPELEP